MPTLSMLDILKELQTIQGLKQKSLAYSAKTNEFIERIHHDYGEEGAYFMKATLQQWGLGDFIEATALPNTTLPPNDKGFIHHDCYQKVLPLCQLALIVEHNGVAEDHAFKLATIFKDEKAVLNYLLQFKDQNAHNYLVHDACLFELPKADMCAFPQWLKLANLYLANPRFRTLLPHAEAIEAMGKMGKKATKQEGQKFDAQIRDKIQDVKKELSTVARQYKSLKKKPLTNPEARMAREEQLKVFSQRLFELQTQLVSLCQGRLPLANIDMIVLEAFYAKYQQEHSAAQQILIQNGISPQNREQFYALKRDNAEKTIPDVLIDGKDIGYPGIYIKKLDTTSDKGAALAACLGKITHCCQYLGGVGSECVVHGIASPNGGFYVLCQGEAQNPSLDDAILAQAWVWKGQNGALCLDSIESAVKQEKIAPVADMFRLLGHTLCQEHHIPQVNTGAQSGISRQVACKDYPAIKERLQDYTGYCDSKSQLPLAGASMPYLFYGKVASSQLQARIAEETKRFFQELFSTQESLHNNEALQQVLAFTLSTKNLALLQLLAQYASNHNEAFDALLANRYYLDQLNQGIIAFDALEQGASINARNKKGQSALHIATLNADNESLSKLIARGINVNIQDKYGNTALIHAFKKVVYKDKNEVGRDIAQQLIAAQAQIEIKDEDENTPLIIAVKNNDLAMVNYLLEYGACLETFDGDMKTALFWAAENGDEAIFDVLLEHGATVNGVSYPEENTPLMAALKNHHFGIAQKILSQKEVAITQKNRYGETALHLAADNPEILKAILALYPENQCLEAVKVENKGGETALYYAVMNPESLKTILELLPVNQRFEAVRIQNKDGNTMLHYAATNSESLKTILELLPVNQRLEAVRIQDKYGRALLYFAATNPESLKIILELLPENQRLEAVIVKNKDGNTVLHDAAMNAESLKTILALLPENQRLEAVIIQDNDGHTVLHLADDNPESLKATLELLPVNQRPEAVIIQDNYGHTVLHLAAINSESLKIVLALLPENQRLEAVVIQDNYGHTVLHHAADNYEILKTILELYSENKRFEAVMSQDEGGNTALHFVASNAKSLKTILELLPENQRLEAVRIKNKNGITVLRHATIVNPESLKTIQALLPAKTDYSNKNKDILIPQNRHSFFTTAKENKSDKYVLHSPAPV
ncbi:ankyrin repeat domain-containing protein [Legionella santicrucis]|uniref:Ankyrin repeat domain-containing protein n=1 Tax=Legionella santicrucis TaxID=45074 RepID=A0A0W0YA22_9GAMM|nr:ankyrin repeat domain-containing protein [Legionella santicrucis]KTD53804.1 ankyrin repeat domain-containing protein [Legionella santicrucis]